jgi:hypothetical protein
MNKALLGLLLGAVLGAIDGLSAWFYPEVRAVEGKVLVIALYSTGKGLIAGLITGAVARKLQNLPLGMVVGLAAGAVLSLVPAMSEDPDTHKVYFWEIMIPGAICGMIVGFATQRFGAAAPVRSGTPLAAVLLPAALLATDCASSDASVQEPGLDAAAAFARMKTLAGTHQAAATDGEDRTQVTYEVSSGGHALLEKLNDGAPEEMVSVYFLEGRDLAMVHYCAIGNRPHLRLDRVSSTIDDLRFEWDDTATDIDPRKDGHIHAARFRFKDWNTCEAEWTFCQEGREAHRWSIQFSRAPPPTAGPPPEPSLK